MATFLKQKGNYRKLIAYQKAECIYDITYYFAHKFLGIGDRTIDQMVQAARSGKQNIAEGSVAATTSTETELKLYNVARASLHELLIDFEDYLRVRNLEQWQIGDTRLQQARIVCREHSDTAYYKEIIPLRSNETIANIAIVLIHQTDLLLGRLLEKRKADFIQQGGIKEEMYKARMEHLKKSDYQ